MKKVLFGLLFILCIYMYNTYFPLWIIEGTYVCSVLDEFGGDPKDGDTLILYDNMVFASSTWGDGKYELEHSFK